MFIHIHCHYLVLLVSRIIVFPITMVLNFINFSCQWSIQKKMIKRTDNKGIEKLTDLTSIIFAIDLSSASRAFCPKKCPYILWKISYSCYIEDKKDIDHFQPKISFQIVPSPRVCVLARFLLWRMLLQPVKKEEVLVMQPSHHGISYSHYKHITVYRANESLLSQILTAP